jgi:hypothetical protein
VNQSAPSGPEVIPKGLLTLPGVGTGNSLKLPEVVICPILLPKSSVNQSAPSGPEVISQGQLAGVGTGFSVIVPEEAAAGASGAASNPTTDTNTKQPARKPFMGAPRRL